MTDRSVRRYCRTPFRLCRRTAEQSYSRTLIRLCGPANRTSGMHVSIDRFEELKSWQEARKLVRLIYHLTKYQAFSRDMGLSRQVQAAAVSSMGNISEAHGRYTFEDKRRFLDISLGSCKEVQSHLYVALDQTYIAQVEFDEAYHQAEVVAQLVTGSLGSLERQIASRSSPRSRLRHRA
jgi:four helix bundle protein